MAGNDVLNDIEKKYGKDALNYINNQLGGDVLTDIKNEFVGKCSRKYEFKVHYSKNNSEGRYIMVYFNTLNQSELIFLWKNNAFKLGLQTDHELFSAIICTLTGFAI